MELHLLRSMAEWAVHGFAGLEVLVDQLSTCVWEQWEAVPLHQRDLEDHSLVVSAEHIHRPHCFHSQLVVEASSFPASPLLVQVVRLTFPPDEAADSIAVCFSHQML